jgi:hypothetical protein
MNTLPFTLKAIFPDKQNETGSNRHKDIEPGGVEKTDGLFRHSLKNIISSSDKMAAMES